MPDAPLVHNLSLSDMSMSAANGGSRFCCTCPCRSVQRCRCDRSVNREAHGFILEGIRMFSKLFGTSEVCSQVHVCVRILLDPFCARLESRCDLRRRASELRRTEFLCRTVASAMSSSVFVPTPAGFTGHIEVEPAAAGAHSRVADAAANAAGELQNTIINLSSSSLHSLKVLIDGRP